MLLQKYFNPDQRGTPFKWNNDRQVKLSNIKQANTSKTLRLHHNTKILRNMRQTESDAYCVSVKYVRGKKKKSRQQHFFVRFTSQRCGHKREIKGVQWSRVSELTKNALPDSLENFNLPLIRGRFNSFVRKLLYYCH